MGTLSWLSSSYSSDTSGAGSDGIALTSKLSCCGGSLEMLFEDMNPARDDLLDRLLERIEFANRVALAVADCP